MPFGMGGDCPNLVFVSTRAGASCLSAISIYFPISDLFQPAPARHAFRQEWSTALECTVSTRAGASCLSARPLTNGPGSAKFQPAPARHAFRRGSISLPRSSSFNPRRRVMPFGLTDSISSGLETFQPAPARHAFRPTSYKWSRISKVSTRAGASCLSANGKDEA